MIGEIAKLCWALYKFSRGDRVYTINYPPPKSEPTATPLRFGILGTAKVAPIALVLPVKDHPDAVVAAVASRDQRRANIFAKKHRIPKAYGGEGAYQRLLDDPEIDVVYIPLPTGLHYEWTMKALAAGKHVLVENPSANTADETRRMFAFAYGKGLILMEAFHYRFHPVALGMKALINRGELGTLTKIEISLAATGVKDNNVRWDYELGGGAMMDLGCYTVSMARYLAGANPTKVISAKAHAHPKFPKVDARTTASLAFPTPGGKKPVEKTPREGTTEASTDGLTANLLVSYRLPPVLGFLPACPKMSLRVTGTLGTAKVDTFPAPWIRHTLKAVISKREGGGGPLGKLTNRKLTEYHRGKLLCTTYKYQLKAFVDRVRGRTPQNWYGAQDSIATMEWIEAIYKETGLGSRPSSTAKVKVQV